MIIYCFLSRFKHNKAKIGRYDMFKKHMRYVYKKLSIFNEKVKFDIFDLILVTKFEKLGHKGPTPYKKLNQKDIYLKKIRPKTTFHIL